MTTEATIMINGYRLTPAQSMTLRRAMEAFLDEMRSPDILGRDELGRNLASAFVRRCEEIRALIDMDEAARPTSVLGSWIASLIASSATDPAKSHRSDLTPQSTR